MRATLCDAARLLTAQVGFASLGTIEFLVRGERFWFMEVLQLSTPNVDIPFSLIICLYSQANPRLQVEHTITEQVTGLDLVGLQLQVLRLLIGTIVLKGLLIFIIIITTSLLPQLALGLGTLDSLVGSQEAIIRQSRGCAIQARINLERIVDVRTGQVAASSGCLTAFDLPTGPGVRVDNTGYLGYCPNANFDSLIAKVIVHASNHSMAVKLLRRALGILSPHFVVLYGNTIFTLISY